MSVNRSVTAPSGELCGPRSGGAGSSAAGDGVDGRVGAHSARQDTPGSAADERPLRRSASARPRTRGPPRRSRSSSETVASRPQGPPRSAARTAVWRRQAPRRRGALGRPGARPAPRPQPSSASASPAPERPAGRLRRRLGGLRLVSGHRGWRDRVGRGRRGLRGAHLDDEGAGSELDPVACLEDRRPLHAPSVDVGAVCGAQVLDREAAVARRPRSGRAGARSRCPPPASPRRRPGGRSRARVPPRSRCRSRCRRPP